MKSSLLIVLLAFCLPALADVRLPDVIGSGMVLQQKQSVPIWGTAEPGEGVTVVFGGKKHSAVADASGKWRVDLGRLTANFNPQTMTITGKNVIELKDILIGEVWLVAGQSNMQRLLRETANGDAVQAAANHPNIRLFNAIREVAFKKRAGKLGEWAACTPDSVKEFSAAGYYFGVEMERELKVPIGLINSSYGGSQAEAWTPVEYLNASPDLKATVDRTKIWDEERGRVRTEYADAINKWREESDKAKAAGGKAVAVAGRAGRTSRLPGRIVDLRRNDRAADPVRHSRRDLVSGRVERGTGRTVWHSAARDDKSVA